MNKTAMILALLSLMAVVYLAQAQKEAPDATESEPEEKPKDNVLLDAEHQFGAHDIIEDGVPKLVEAKVGHCLNARNKRKCRICCEAHKQSFLFALKPHVHPVRIFECHCFTKITSVTANQDD